jgi:hypothetical protein
MLCGVTTRRPLGTGPTAPADHSAGRPGRRLLPVERAESGVLLEDGGDYDQEPGQPVRRRLGTGQNG